MAIISVKTARIRNEKSRNSDNGWFETPRRKLMMYLNGIFIFQYASRCLFPAGM